MIRFSENQSLKQLNTFGVDARAKFFFEFTELEDLTVFLNANSTWKEEPVLIVGEGSNLLFTDNFDGLVIHPHLPGMGMVKEDRQNVWVEVGAGVNWDEFVQFAVENQLGGVENLSLIPGTAGAAPVQNIGAYGQEVSTTVETVKGYDLNLNQPVEYKAQDCDFGYRNSVFKSRLKNTFIITSVVFRLEKFPEFVLNYGALEETVKARGKVNLQQIRRAVIDIRQSKLPDVLELPNAGSFFKNPVVEADKANTLKAQYPELPVFEAPGGFAKIAAAWLIEKAGWKGYRKGDVGVHTRQALVLVNYGHASGKDIFRLSEEIKQSVQQQFGVELEREVNCV